LLNYRNPCGALPARIRQQLAMLAKQKDDGGP
jgi:hypothetical protein